MANELYDVNVLLTAHLSNASCSDGHMYSTNNLIGIAKFLASYSNICSHTCLYTTAKSFYYSLLPKTDIEKKCTRIEYIF